ncbi:Uncharacterized protein Adt_13720 [Abeliophyllum distichum]|uniref:Uncharacterized protein n=1 Tax=Abeliophyllum distichum TaxID=126358 RepID=A0ABD1TY66_9LAMI
MFTTRIINDHYGITTDDIHPLPSIQDMGEVAQFLYGRNDAWPLPGRDFEHSKLTDSLLILNVFVSHNIHPTRHRTTINDARARLLYHLAHKRKMDLENYNYILISMLGLPDRQEAHNHLPSSDQWYLRGSEGPDLTSRARFQC